MNDMFRNKKALALIGIGIALLILVVAVAAGGGLLSTTNDGNSSVVIETPSIPTITSTPTPTATTSNTVYDAVYVQMLLDESWKSVVADPKHPEYVKTMTTTILFQTRTYDEVIWNYEDFQVFYPVDFNPDKVLFYGFTDDAPENSLYAGPIVLWLQEEPGGEIIYTVGSGCWITDGIMGWKKEPYRYGIVTYKEPPKEVIKIFEEAGRTLIY